MARAHLLGPPPDVADGACAACLMRAKQAQWEAYKVELEEVWAADADTPVKYLAWLPALDKQIYRGDYVAIWPGAPQLGLMRLCWDDVAGIDASRPLGAELDTDTKLPPGLLKGKR